MAAMDLFIFYVLIHLLLALHSAEGVNTLCPPYFCNDVVGTIMFPFKNKTHPPECGLYSVDCSNPPHPKVQLKEGGYWYGFESITQLGSVIIKDELLNASLMRKNYCSDEFFNNLSLPSSSPIAHASTHNLTVFRCNGSTLDEEASYRKQCKTAKHTYYTSSNNSLPISPPQCSTIQLPAVPGEPINDLSTVTAQFTLEVSITKCIDCISKKGECQVDKEEFKCFFGSKPPAIIPPPIIPPPDSGKKDGEEKSWKLRVGLGIGIGGIALLVACSLFMWCRKRKIASSNLLSRNISSQPNSKSDLEGGAYFMWRKILCLSFLVKKNKHHRTDEAFLKNYGPLQVKRYSYSDVKKMTNSFQEKLGQGGYGGVYKGKLNDGRPVAVKVLNRSKGNGEEFMNEVAAISRTSHVNIVSLLGFCFEGSKRALIYEFMPNGSLEKYIFDTNNPQKDHPLGWEALHQISLGIARGLEYLHRGCNTRILHFDIKPHNILLDENFLPKISDFGLAKICDRKESIVSMLCARGTAGYIAPEVFCRSFGGVSHKSDVYSYGMMLSEMAGGRRNINVDAENTSEIYFPHWIYKRLELDEELGLHGIMNEEDKVRARKMIIISLWCIQTDPSNRPAMKEVIEMFEGSVDSLQIPPKPFLSSPAKSPPESADNSATLVSLQ